MPTVSSALKIVIASVLYILYYAIVVFPFLSDNLLTNGVIGKWKSDAALIRYALLFCPALWVYLCVIVRNILNVRYLRSIVYPFLFLMFFAVSYAVLLIWGTSVLWSMLLTVPVGVIVFFVLILMSFKQDIRDKAISLKEDNLHSLQQGLNIIAYYIVPCVLAAFVFFATAGKTAVKAEEKTEAQAEEKTEAQAVPSDAISEIPLAEGCGYVSGLLRKAAEKINLNADDSLEKIAAAYQDEFRKKEIYGRIELNRSESDTAEFYLYRDKIVWLILTFEKKGRCERDSRNCFWSLAYGKDPCVRYVTADKE